MTFITRTAGALVALALALPASAGGFAQSEAQLREAYGAYRAALFLSNQGKAQETAQALAKFDAAWTQLATEWRADPPPQYAGDAQLDATLGKVAELAAKAGEEVSAGKLPQAHEVLESVRGQIGGLHARAGLIGFSDRMNAYHAELEAVLARDYATLGERAAPTAIGDAAVLAYLAGEIAANPAPEAAAQGYGELIAGFEASVADFVAAAQGGDPVAIKAAQDKLKVPYSKLFAKFG